MSHSVRHLLLVEDDPSWRKRLADAAHAEGVAVSHASDGVEALDWLRTHPRAGHPDLILLDLMLPRMDGWELYGQLRTDARLRHLNVLMFSEALHGQEVPLGGVVGYLHKPAMPESMMGAVRSRLRFAEEIPAREPSGTYALELREDVSLPLRLLPAPVAHSVRMHLLRAAELVGTELPMASTWLMALPGTPPALLVCVEGVRVVLDVDDEARVLRATSVDLPPGLLTHS
ncbi:response regulator [Myxococcus sp. K38C18041901]|uniref:response regulator n=1 Tax=Myxococcus guangdongensis TaxID=2906760 RepID=UPI0020A7BA50|nr:response regulator [Myxococcus guangdongensis]MCP3058998.1 response regulator [Myxococcus guangdongensis]